MGEVKRYRVNVNGNDAVLKLTEQDAKRYEDAELVDTQPATETADTAAEPKAKTPANKARTAQNKTAKTDGAAGNR